MGAVDGPLELVLQNSIQVSQVLLSEVRGKHHHKVIWLRQSPVIFLDTLLCPEQKLRQWFEPLWPVGGWIYGVPL